MVRNQEVAMEAHSELQYQRGIQADEDIDIKKNGQADSDFNELSVVSSLFFHSTQNVRSKVKVEHLPGSCPLNMKLWKANQDFRLTTA